ncbi:hypothetical protein B0H12DRAFT_1300797 [Mycena haematopus]|nr:hypothetical protein B0H12DRAFT_1300797 [Mycena haematopus]
MNLEYKCRTSLGSQRWLAYLARPNEKLEFPLGSPGFMYASEDPSVALGGFDLEPFLSATGAKAVKACHGKAKRTYPKVGLPPVTVATVPRHPWHGCRARSVGGFLTSTTARVTATTGRRNTAVTAVARAHLTAKCNVRRVESSGGNLRA